MVRGNCDAEYHKDAAEPTLDKLHADGIGYDVLGGGRIQVTNQLGCRCACSAAVGARPCARRCIPFGPCRQKGASTDGVGKRRRKRAARPARWGTGYARRPPTGFRTRRTRNLCDAAPAAALRALERALTALTHVRLHTSRPAQNTSRYSGSLMDFRGRAGPASTSSPDPARRTRLHCAGACGAWVRVDANVVTVTTCETCFCAP